MTTSCIINSIKIDLAALYSISHICDQSICRDLKCCCSCYEVCVNQKEISVLTDYIPQAARLAKKLKTKGGFKNIFEQQERSLFSLDTDNDGLCLFAYKNKTRDTLCSLHSVALSSDISPHKVKPKSCTLWPLALSESKPYLLSIDDEAFSFGCNKKRKGNPKKLDPNISDIIRALFGNSFLKSIENHRQNQ